MRYLSPVHPHVVPRPLSLCWGQRACLQDTGTPVAYWAEVDSKPQYQWLNVLSRVSWGEESLSAMPNGRTEENRQGGRKNTGGYYRSSTGLFNPTRAAVLQSSSGASQQTPEDDSIFLLLLQRFSICLSHNFTASLKRKSIYHSAQMCESLNRWKTSSQRQRFPTGPPATCKTVWISVVTNWQTFSSTTIPVCW